MKVNSTIKKTVLLATLSLLSSACSFSTIESVIKTDEGFQKVKGTVTKIVNQIIPTAYADDSVKVCRSQKSGSSANVVNVYLLENGVETKICDADILSNGEFEVEIKKELIPANAVVIFKSQFNGGHREKLAISSEIQSNTNLEVNPFSTAVSNSLKKESMNGVIDSSKVTKANTLVHGIFGSDVRIGASANVANFIKNATENEAFRLKALSYLNGTASLTDVEFKNIKTQVERVKNGKSVVFDEQQLYSPQSTLKRYEYFKRSRERDHRRSSVYWAYTSYKRQNRMDGFLRRQFNVGYTGQRPNGL